MKKFIILSLVLVLLGSIIEPFRVNAEQKTGFDYNNYYELEYIESDGTQFINLGSFSSGDVFEYDFKLTNYSASYGIFGYNSSNSNRFALQNVNSKFRFLIGSQGQSIADTNYDRHKFIYNGNQTGTFDGVSFTTNNNNYSTSDFYIFRTNGLTYFCNQRVYYVKKGNNIYIPAQSKLNNSIGLYNTTTQTFIGNSGSGSFIGGSIIVYDTYTVTTSSNPSNGGSVIGGGVYSSGDTATLTAIPNSGYVFSSWSNGQTSNPLNLIVNSDISITANFTQEQQTTYYNVTTSSNPSNGGSVSGGGSFPENTSVTLTAIPNSGYVFSSWSNGSTSNPLTFILTSDTNITANFTQELQVTTYTISVDTDPALGGSVSGGGTYQSGTTISLSAIPNNGYMFSGWYINDYLVYNSNPLSLLVDNNYNFVAKFTLIPVDDTFTPFTDDNDILSMKEITSQYSKDDFVFTISKRKVLDGIITDTSQITTNTSSFGDIRIVGQYYDNTIIGLTACNSTSITQTNIDTSPTENVTIRPFVTGHLSAGEYGYLDYGIEVVDVNQGATSTTSSSVNNTTEACKLVGMETGDGAVDQETLRQLGYTRKTIEYNDGSTYGHTATVYVPGYEDIGFQINSSDLRNMLNSLMYNINQNFYQLYHYEYDVSLTMKSNKVMPSSGYIRMNIPLAVFLNDLFIIGEQLDYDLLQNLNTRYTLLNNSDPIATNNGFNYHISNGKYDRNYIELYWNGKNNPSWHFSTNSTTAFLEGNWQSAINMRNTMTVTNYTPQNSYNEIYTVTSSDVENNSQLTAGIDIQVGGINTFNLYRVNDNSILNRFNQLGSFLNGWFSRLYNSISNITGGSESNDVTNNIITNNNIDVDYNINNSITNLKDKDNDINLQLPEFTIDNDHMVGIGKLSQLTGETFKAFSDNDLGILIILPIIIMILGLIL